MGKQNDGNVVRKSGSNEQHFQPFVIINIALGEQKCSASCMDIRTQIQNFISHPSNANTCLG